MLIYLVMNQSAEIVAVARFVPRPEAGERVRAALERVTVATHGEPGCILLALHRGEGGDFLQVGKWETLEHWRAHGDAASVRHLDRELEGHLAGEREIAWYRPLAVGEPGKRAL
jgi:quinol monooxygenase YgiN